MSKQINNSQKVIDTRKLVERFNELKASLAEARKDEVLLVNWIRAYNHELVTLEYVVLAVEQACGRSCAEGRELVRDSYFEEYAKAFAEDACGIRNVSDWPAKHIDWAAAVTDLQQDWKKISFDGVTYWIRG